MSKNKRENMISEKDKDEYFEKAFDTINKSIKDSSNTFSTIGRYVVTSLLVFTWGLLFKEDIGLEWHVLTLVLLLLAYFVIDITQYLFITLAYSKHNNELNAAFEVKIFTENQILEAEKKNRKYINNISFCFFIIKSVLLLPIFLFFIFFLLQILSRNTTV